MVPPPDTRPGSRKAQAAAPPIRLHLACRVIDNFGDAGASWRLARQLATEHGLAVTLLIDRPEVLARLVPDLVLAGRDAHAPGEFLIRRWPPVDAVPAAPAGSADTTLPDVLVCAYGCDPPATLRARLAGAPARPLWIELDYLSAESWVADFHALPSLKPADGARAWRFFPGFTPGTGGLPREQALTAARSAFAHSDSAQRWWWAHGLPDRPGLRLSIFCYPEAPLTGLLDALAEAETSSIAVVPAPVASAQVDTWLATHGVRAVEAAQAFSGPWWQAGALTLVRPPLLPIDDYDRLLWQCDINLVRGEDSWIRALWAGRPFVWQPYRQSDRAHEAKREAFLHWQRDSLGALDAAQAAAMAQLEALSRIWCEGAHPAAAWQRVRAALPLLSDCFVALARRAASEDDLATKLVRFCRSKL